MINNEAFSILCSQVLDDTVNVFINKHNVLISNILSPMIESVVNKALGPKTTKELLINKDVSLNFNEDQVMELRQVFFEEFKKNPIISKYVSF